MATTRVFLFDRWLEIDPTSQLIRVVPFRLPSILTGIAMLAIPASLLNTVRAGAYVLTTTGVVFVAAYSVLAVVLLLMPFRPSNTLVELDLAKKIIRRRGAETLLSQAAMRYVQRERRGEAFATIGGQEVRFLHLANDFVDIARLVVHAGAAGIRGEPEALLASLVAEATRQEWKAWVGHLMFPLVTVGAGAFFYVLYL